jgi:hypothetical protein
MAIPVALTSHSYSADTGGSPIKADKILNALYPPGNSGPPQTRSATIFRDGLASIYKIDSARSLKPRRVYVLLHYGSMLLISLL